ncbi:MAG: hypothetical protein U0528_17175 [Anaerolineae bacterium]
MGTPLKLTTQIEVAGGVHHQRIDHDRCRRAGEVEVEVTVAVGVLVGVAEGATVSVAGTGARWCSGWSNSSELYCADVAMSYRSLSPSNGRATPLIQIVDRDRANPHPHASINRWTAYCW